MTPRRRGQRRLSRSPFAKQDSPRSLGQPSKTRTTPSTRSHASSRTSSPRRSRRNFQLSEVSGTRSTSSPGLVLRDAAVATAAGSGPGHRRLLRRLPQGWPRAKEYLSALESDVKKATGGWRIVHAFNKLIDATIPAQTPIPRKDMVLDTMSGSVIYSEIDLTDGFYQILMRESGIPLTAVSIPSGMPWEWLVMLQGLKNAPATFNRMVSHVLRPLRAFAPSYFDDICVHSRAEGGLSAVDVHLRHLRKVFKKMRENKLYANLKKCVFCAPEILVLGCYVSKSGVRADPEMISSICSWPTPKNQTELRQGLGLANYLRKYTKDYAGLIQPMSSLLKKDVTWNWRPEHQDAFDAVKKSLAFAPVLTDLSTWCATQVTSPSDAPSCSLMLRAVGASRPDYDPRRLTRHQDIPDDDDDANDCATCVTLVINATVSSPVLPLRQQIADAFEADAFYAATIRYLRNPTADTLAKLTRPTRDAITRYDLDGDLLTYAIDTFDTPRVVIPADDDLRARLVHEYHDAPAGGHLGREKTFAAFSRDFFWPRKYKWIRKWVRSCEICQRVKPAAFKQAPHRPLPIATSAWRSVSMDFIFGLPRDAEGRAGVLVFVGRFSKMVHLAPVAAEVTADESAELFLDLVFRHHGLPESIVSDRDPRFTSAFWTRLFALLGSRLLMSTAAHPETDGQTERVNRVLEDVLRSYATYFASWSSFLPMAVFALNNSTHASTGLTPFFVKNARHPRVQALLAVRSSNAAAVSTLADVASPATSAVADFAPAATPTPIDSAAVSEFLLHRQAVTQFVRDALKVAVDRQKANADRRGRKNMSSFRRGERVLLSTEGIQSTAVTNLGANKLAPRFIGPFKILKVIGDAYTLAIPTAMRLHPTFYVGRLKPNVPATIPAPEAERPRPARNPSRPAADADAESARALAPHASASPSVTRRTRAAPSDETASASRAAPAPTESQQSSQPQYARAQAQRGSEPPSRRPSLDRSSASSSGAPSDVSIRSSETPRQSPKPPKLPKRAPTRRPFAEICPPPLVDASGARRWIAERIVDHETRRTRATGAVPTSRRARATERYYRVRWLGFPPAKDTWESRERLMEDIPDVVKEYEATLPLAFDDSSLEEDHDLVSFIAHEYARHESLSNDDAFATSISDEAPANSRDANSRGASSRGASSRDHSDDDHAARSVDIDVSTATSSATRSVARSAMLPSTCTCIARA
ncbi:hypothetical protein PR003_g5887 [Phytophthora rubi]|uniref:Transposon Tf2-6 polyprotein n=1 Tax=Phytophthora rubi TaxID=129364 RepID=A0A6A4FRG1_9STRA|nr:hypothetical protein PR003_g5887 [Phytophthora rubi]